MKTIVKIILSGLLCTAAVFFTCLYLSMPKIENLETLESVSMIAGQEKQVIQDCYPDPSFARLRVVDRDPDCVLVKDDKFTIKALKEGTTEIICYDRNVEIRRIKITVFPSVTQQ